MRGGRSASSLGRMAVFHLATNTPTKVEILTGWIPTTPWGKSHAGELDIVGSFHLDDPGGSDEGEPGPGI